MNKSLLIFLITSLSSTTLTMERQTPTLKDVLRLQGISKKEILQLHGIKKEIIERMQDKDSAILQITSLLHKEDVADMRLVCKEWAPKDKNWKDKQHWTFMPNDVENEHDKLKKKKCKITGLDQTILLFHFTIQNNFKAVQWITYNTNTYKALCDNLQNSQWTIRPCMIAIHNKNPEMARFLIETHSYYKDNNWKYHYNTITIPKILQDCLYPDDDHNFLFLFYCIAVMADNVDDLKELYAQKKPTQKGSVFLIALAKDCNATNCLAAKVKKENTNPEPCILL